MKVLFEKIEQFRLMVVFILLALIAVMAYLASSVKVDNSINVWFVESDPALISYRNFLDQFGNDEAVIIALTDTSDKDIHKRIAESEQIANTLVDLPGVSRVLGPAFSPRFNNRLYPKTRHILICSLINPMFLQISSLERTIAQ